MLTIIIIALIITIVFYNKFKKIIRKNKKKIFYSLALILFIILIFRGGITLLTALVSFLVLALALANKVINIFSHLSFFSHIFQNAKSAPQSNQPTNKMSKEEAWEILGVSSNASKKQIKEAYYNLMKKNHPDQGGSKYLATKINQAKDLLLDQ